LFGPKFIKAIKGPLPFVQIMPTGGVDVNNAAEWIKAGAVALGAGGSLIGGDYGKIVSTAKEFIKNIKAARGEL
jgi:2-dehydro-3-deoxyphosphogluconate aldolase/(4S)-4-hydroxy-2-oxoglutarate aldolase